MALTPADSSSASQMNVQKRYSQNPQRCQRQSASEAMRPSEKRAMKMSVHPMGWPSGLFRPAQAQRQKTIRTEPIRDDQKKQIRREAAVAGFCAAQELSWPPGHFQLRPALVRITDLRDGVEQRRWPDARLLR